MGISAKWVKDSLNSDSNQGYIVRDGIDSAATGYRYDNLGLIYLDKNNNKSLDAADLVIGSIVDTQSGQSGQLRQDASQSGLYSIRSDGNSSATSGISVVFDADFNSGKPVAPPAPKVIKAVSTGSSSTSSGVSSDASPGSIFNSSAKPQPSVLPATLPSSGPFPGVTLPSSGPFPSATIPTGTLGASYPGIANSSGSVASTSGGGGIGSFQDASGNVIAPPAQWSKLRPISYGFIKDLVMYFLPIAKDTSSQTLEPSSKQLDLSAFGLDANSALSLVSRSRAAGGDVLRSNAISISSSSSSALLGDKGNDIIYGARGSDLIDGAGGNDIIKAGDGNDIIAGGAGADQIYGGFGRNIFLSEIDESPDRLYITSDQFVPNPNAVYQPDFTSDGSNVDVITGLDVKDKITIIGVFTSELSFYQSAAPSGLSGIGIYASNKLEAIYTGSNLSISQLAAMTTGANAGYQNVINSL